MILEAILRALKCASWSVCTHDSVQVISATYEALLLRFHPVCPSSASMMMKLPNLPSTLSYLKMNRCVVVLGNETGQSNELSGKNWIALEREIETSLVRTQTLISCGWPADCINIQLLFESHRYEIWTWVRALQLDREALTNTPLHTYRHTHSLTSRLPHPGPDDPVSPL